MNKWKITLALLMGLAAAPDAPAQKPAAGNSDVTVITSERLTFDYMKKFAFFEKDVVVVDPQMKIYADSMLVRFNNANKATYIKAEGNVIIIQADKRARGNMAEYDVEQGVITLSGNPMITSGKNIFTAELIKFWRDDNRMEGKPKSRLVIYPENDASRDKLFLEPVRGR